MIFFGVGSFCDAKKSIFTISGACRKSETLKMLRQWIIGASAHNPAPSPRAKPCAGGLRQGGHVCPPPRNAAALHADASQLVVVLRRREPLPRGMRDDGEAHCPRICGALLAGRAHPPPWPFLHKKSYSLRFGAADQYDVDKPWLSSGVGYCARQNNAADPHNQQNIMANGAHRPFSRTGLAVALHRSCNRGIAAAGQNRAC